MSPRLIWTGIGLGVLVCATLAMCCDSVQRLYQSLTRDPNQPGVSVSSGTEVNIPRVDGTGRQVPDVRQGAVLIAMPSCDTCSAYSIDAVRLPNVWRSLPVIFVYPDRHSQPKKNLRSNMLVDTVPSFLPGPMRVFKPQSVVVGPNGMVKESIAGALAIESLLHSGGSLP